MPNQYDFNPRTTPLNGISLGDIVAAKRSPLTALAQGTPPILEALRQRALLQQQQNMQQQFFQGLANPAMATGAGNLSTDQLMAGLRSGALDPKGALELSPITQKKRQAEIENIDAQAALRRQQAKDLERLNTELQKGGKFATVDPYGNVKITELPGVMAPKGGGLVGKENIPMTPGQKLEDTINAAKKIGEQMKQEQLQKEGGLAPQAMGNQIQFSYDLNGQTHTATVPSTPQAIKAAKQRVISNGGKNFRIGNK